MIRRLLLIAALLMALPAWAALDVNQATEAELDSIKGIGPGLSSRILQARQERPFADWPDLIQRVSGVGPRTATRFSSEGLTVNGKRFSAAAAARLEARQKGDPSPRAPRASGSKPAAHDLPAAAAEPAAPTR